jgi:alanyl-tRNA synthetase
LGLPKDRLRVSVFETDDESAEIWHKQEGLPLDRIARFGEKDNFWSMGDTGPCGPCTEILLDQGKDVDGERWLEFWNLVFMHYARSADGRLNPLPKPSVDTGMGLERVAAIMQGVPSNYDIDPFKDLIEFTSDYLSHKIKKKFVYSPTDTSWQMSALKVIVDHLRSTSFLIADGVLPSNEGRGYVLRGMLRRAVRFGKRLGLTEPFLGHLLPELQKAMSAQFPELNQRQNVILEVLKQEEEKFFETLDKGLALLDEALLKMGSQKTLAAETVFKLYDTFGFPVDLTALIAREKNLVIDKTGFQKLMRQQQDQSRKSWKGSGEAARHVHTALRIELESQHPLSRSCC